MKIANVINEEISKLINEYYSDVGIVRLYHKIMGKLPMNELIDSVIKRGLIPNDNGERGRVIWFSDDYNDYAKNGAFVVAIDFDTKNNGYANNKFGILYEGHNAFAINQIPFNDLIIIKIPVIRDINGQHMPQDILIEWINMGRITPEDFNDKNTRANLIYGDIFEKYVQPKINISNFLLQIKNSDISIVNVMS